MSKKTPSPPKIVLANFVEVHKKFNDVLTEAFNASNVKILKKVYESFTNNSDADKKPGLDQAFRELLLLKLIDDIDKVGAVISLSIEAVREDIVSVTIPVVLLGDAFDAVTLEKCEQIFTFVEDRVSVWKEEIFFVNCKNNILRMCNDLLRRLSRAQNTVFCGRILLFLAKFFPFSERSGLNVISEFNLDNITEFGVDDKDSDEVLPDTLDDVPVKIDYNLYCKFWTLQEFFRNPNQCYTKVQWKVFASHASAVLSAFSSFKLEEPRSSSSKKRKRDTGNTPMEIDDEKNFKTEHFFAKFLTNPKLLALQLSDSNFRRSVLVQFLILFQYLSSTVKFKTESFTLNQIQTDFIKETESKIYKLLDETPPQGKKFTKTVQHMLQREEIWNNWKNEGCKDFNKPENKESNSEEQPTKPKKQKRSLGDHMKEATRKGQFYMGTTELSRLWNLAPDNLSACKSEDRNFLPQLETYLENPREKNDPSFEWRALRLLARQSPHFFTSVNTSSASYKVVDHLENVRRKILKDKNETTKMSSAEGNNSTIIEPQENESVALEEQEDTELMKTETLVTDDHNTHKTNTVTKENIAELSAKVDNDWKKLGKKLGFTQDELSYFETENKTVISSVVAMLTIWFQDDEDATLDNLAYILEGLDMPAAADVCKTIIDPPNKMEEISD